MKFNKKLQTIFLDPHSEYPEFSSKVNIILSPALYWVKKVSLPVKHIRDAKKLLPSIFEDILPEGSYSYSVYKSANEFFIFAYSDKLILDTLSQKGISSSNIAKIYFAQSEIKDIEGALKINETQSIYIKDELLILVPCCWIKEKDNLDISGIKHSKHTVTLTQFGHIVDSKSIYKIGAILVFLILLIGSEYFITTQKSASVNTLKDKLFDKYKLKSTMFQNRALLKKYKTLHQSQSKLREYISYILALRLKGSEKILYLNLKNRKISVGFSGLKKGDEKHIVSFLKSKGMIFESKFSKDTFKVEAKI